MTSDQRTTVGPGRRLPSPGQLARLWPRVRPYRGGLALATIALLASAVIGLAFPQIVRYLLDAAFLRHDRGLLDRIGLLLLVLFAVQAGLNYVQTYYLSATGERAVAGLRRELFDKLLTMPPGFFADRRTGELTSRLTTDIGLLQSVMSHQIAEFSRQALALLGGVVILTYMQPRLTFTALGVVPLVVGSAFYFGRRLRRMTTGVQDKVAEATAVAEEALSQIRTVQSFVQEPAERQRYGERVLASVRAALVRAEVRGVFFGVLTFTTFGGIVFVLWQGGLLVLDGKLSPGSLVSFLLYTVTIAAAIGGLASFFSSYQEAVGAAQRVFELLETVSPIADQPSPQPLPKPVRGDVRFQRVSFRYQPDPAAPWVLRDIICAEPSAWSHRNPPSSAAPFTRTSRTDGPRRRRTRSRQRPEPPTHTSSSSSYLRGTTLWSASAASSSPAGNGSGSPSRGRCSRTLPCSSWTKRPAAWTTRASGSSRTRWSGCSRAGRR